MPRIPSLPKSLPGHGLLLAAMMAAPLSAGADTPSLFHDRSGDPLYSFGSYERNRLHSGPDVDRDRAPGLFPGGSGPSFSVSIIGSASIGWSWGDARPDGPPLPGAGE